MKILEQMIYEDSERLADEMNFRLLVRVSNGEETILWVDRVCITSIYYPSRKRKTKIMAIIYKLLKRKKE